MVADPFRLLAPEQYVLLGLALLVAASGSFATAVLEFQNRRIGPSAPISRTNKLLFGSAIAASGFYYIQQQAPLMDAVVAFSAIVVLGLPVGVTVLVVRQLVVEEP